MSERMFFAIQYGLNFKSLIVRCHVKKLIVYGRLNKGLCIIKHAVRVEIKASAFFQTIHCSLIRILRTKDIFSATI